MLKFVSLSIKSLVFHNVKVIANQVSYKMLKKTMKLIRSSTDVRNNRVKRKRILGRAYNFIIIEDIVGNKRNDHLFRLVSKYEGIFNIMFDFFKMISRRIFFFSII